MRALVLAIIAVIAMSAFTPAVAKRNMGLVGIKSAWGRYLQAHTDGETHASNGNRYREETWFLIKIDRRPNVFAILNYRTKLYLRSDNGCARAISGVLGPHEQWIMRSGRSRGMVNAVTFVSVATGKTLATDRPGQDHHCGGEVVAEQVLLNPPRDSMWGGWWTLEQASPPDTGPDAITYLNAVGQAVGGLVKDLNAADVAAVLALLL